MSHLLLVDATRFNVDAVSRAIAKGHEVTFVETDAFRSRYAHPSMEATLAAATRRVMVESPLASEAAYEAIAAIHSRHPIDGMLTTIDANVQATARVGRRLGVRSTSLEGVVTAKNKASTRQALARSGLASCRHASAVGSEGIRNAAATLRFPMVVKPTLGYGKLLTRTLETTADLEDFLGEYELLRAGLDDIDQGHISDEMVLEEFIVGPMYSVEIGIDERGVYPFMVTERRRPEYNLLLELGSSMPTAAPIELRNEISSYACRVVGALGLDIGIFHLEVIASVDGPVLVEANARLMGGALPMLYSRATDDSIFDHLVDIHLGQPVQWRPVAAPRVATARQIAPVHGGRARRDVDVDFLRERCPWIASAAIDVRADQEIRPMTCNFDSLGYFHVAADSHAESLLLAERGLTCLEEALGVQLAR